MKHEKENSQKVRAIIAQMNESSVGMARSSNMAPESAAGVARLLGTAGDDVTRQINVHTDLGPHEKNGLHLHLKKSVLCSLSRCFFGFSECKSVRSCEQPEAGEIHLILTTRGAKQNQDRVSGSDQILPLIHCVTATTETNHNFMDLFTKDKSVETV